MCIPGAFAVEFIEMRQLLLLRHAKSSWDDPALADFERPLNQRGERAAPFMGELMTREGLAPAVIVSSPAVRARSTAEAVTRAGVSAQLVLDDRIYEASPQALRQVASELNDEFEVAMLVGHNPGMEGFIRLLTGEVEPMATAALAVIDLRIDHWDDLTAQCGKIRRVYRPKEEMADE